MRKPRGLKVPETAEHCFPTNDKSRGKELGKDERLRARIFWQVTLEQKPIESTLERDGFELHGSTDTRISPTVNTAVLHDPCLVASADGSGGHTGAVSAATAYVLCSCVFLYGKEKRKSEDSEKKMSRYKICILVP